MNQVTKRGWRVTGRLRNAAVMGVVLAAMITAVACDTGTSSSSGPRRQEVPAPPEGVEEASLISDIKAGGTIGVIHFVIEALDEEMSQHTGSVTVDPDGEELKTILKNGGTVSIEFNQFKPTTPDEGFPPDLKGLKLDGTITVEVSIADEEQSLTLSTSTPLETGLEGDISHLSFDDAQLIFTKLPLDGHGEEPRGGSGQVRFGKDGTWHEMSGIVDALRAVSSTGNLIEGILVKRAQALMEDPSKESVTKDSAVLVEWLNREEGKLAIHLDGFRPGDGVTLRGRFDMTITTKDNGDWETIELDGALTIQGHSLGYIGFGAEGAGGLVLGDLKEDAIPGEATGWVITDTRKYDAEKLFRFGRFLEDMGIMGD
ncbi:hypothetical protein SAMN05920897_10189 [Alkalispirochaeta americana]|uniref:Lipoprotein n=1 Tax=Alkalispirochaeta americana TaxID=159291 RepID=A0A1N6N795_9SPIO|nr:hypothetical protein [Alkalispirochaeta americana]SIP87931.1 hypothetical protein SAMN05920897_10189 [Alkalispirochaeta americana]